MFSSAEIRYEGLDNFGLIKQELVRRYGLPEHGDPTVNAYIWSMKKQRLAITLRYYRTGNGTVLYNYFP